MASDLVSIIIPVYNSEKYLEKCLNSILEQTYEYIEIIAIDDGSTDLSSKILEKFSDKIKIITQKNTGLTSALLLGLDNMKGKWFKWFSPDDFMYPDFVEIMIRETRKKSDTIFYSNWDIIDENGKKLREFEESDYNELSNFDYNVRLLDKQLINVNTTLIPFSLFEKCTFKELDDPVAVDYDFFLRSGLLHGIKFHLISKPLIQYRIHSRQLSHKNIMSTLDFIEKLKHQILLDLDDSLRKKYLDELKKYQKTKSIKQKTLDFAKKILPFLPDTISNNLLIFYLNKVRQGR